MKLMTGVFFMAIAILSFNSCNKSEQPENPIPSIKKFTNPVFYPVLADPSVLDNRSRDGYFYAYGTQDNWGTTPALERIVPILRSKDLINWEYMGDAFSQPPNWRFGESLVWAPDIEYRNGKYYLYYSLAVWAAPNPGIGVAVSDTPYGTFTDLGKILDSNDSGVKNSIDPYFFIDDDGKYYLFWGSFEGIYCVPMNDDGVTPRLDDKFMIAGHAFEGVIIFRRANYYYFFGSVGTCCFGANSTYHVTVARSENLKGPYLDKNGNDIMDAMDWGYGENDTKNLTILTASGKVIGPGHNSEIVQDDEGQDWILYHGIIKPNYNLPNGATRRPLFLDKVIWDSEGWPKIGVGTPSESETDAPEFK